MTLLRTPVIVLDTETTGIFNKHPFARIWDLAAVVLDVDGSVIDTFEQVILPEVLDDRANDALKIGGVTQEWIRENGVLESEAILLWGRFLSAHPGAKCTAFNIQFDRPMLKRCGLDDGIDWGPCLMRLAQAEMGPAGALPQWDNGEYKFPKLSEAATYYAIPQHEPAHRALADAKTAADILLKIQHRKINPMGAP